MKKEVTIGGISISNFESIEDAITTEIITSTGVKPGVAIAINPEKIVTALAQPELKKIIDNASLRYPDGIGVAYVMGKKLGKKISRIPGCELWESIMTRSGSTQIPVYIMGGTNEVIGKTKEKLINSGVNIVGYRNGYFEPDQQSQIINEIVASGAKIVSVALGSPKQELFIYQCKALMPNTFFMGVGGTYDVYIGNVKRAPYFFRKMHAEWLFRLLSQPTRLSRQIKLFKYITLYFKGKL